LGCGQAPAAAIIPVLWLATQTKSHCAGRNNIVLLRLFRRELLSVLVGQINK